MWVLYKLLWYHPNRDRFRKQIEQRSEWPLATLSKEEIQDNVLEALTFRNHKGASTKPKLLQALLNEDAIHGFAVLLPLSKISWIKGILLAPLNIQAQNTIDSIGRIIPKDRLTHDQSFQGIKLGTPVNSRVNKEELLPCVFREVVQRSTMLHPAIKQRYCTGSTPANI
jgi:hypothetical protein